jgi:hypothetical protein
VSVDGCRGHSGGGDAQASITASVPGSRRGLNLQRASKPKTLGVIWGVVTISSRGRQQLRQQHGHIAAVSGELQRRGRPGRRRQRTALSCRNRVEDRGAAGVAVRRRGTASEALAHRLLTDGAHTPGRPSTRRLQGCRSGAQRWTRLYVVGQAGRVQIPASRTHRASTLDWLRASPDRPRNTQPR